VAGPVLFLGFTNHEGVGAIQVGVKVLSTIVVVFAALVAATATPIQPDIKKLLSTPRPTQHFAPARAGWNGPEAATSLPQVSPDLAQFSPAGQQRNLRQTLVQIATPDWRIFLGLGSLIFLLRMLRRKESPKLASVAYPGLVDGDLRTEQRRPAA
jgi:hypothetical protein